MLRTLLIFIAFIACSIVSAQNGSISGVVIDKNAQTPLVGATVVLENTSLGAISDVDGKFYIEKIQPGTEQWKGNVPNACVRSIRPLGGDWHRGQYS